MSWIGAFIAGAGFRGLGGGWNGGGEAEARLVYPKDKIGMTAKKRKCG